MVEYKGLASPNTTIYCKWCGKEIYADFADMDSSWKHEDTDGECCE